jgi:hypothetical protein
VVLRRRLRQRQVTAAPRSPAGDTE